MTCSIIGSLSWFELESILLSSLTEKGWGSGMSILSWSKTPNTLYNREVTLDLESVAGGDNRSDSKVD